MRRTHCCYQVASKTLWESVYGDDLGKAFLTNLHAVHAKKDFIGAVEVVTQTVTAAVWGSLPERSFNLAAKIANSLPNSLEPWRSIEVLSTVEGMDPKLQGLSTIWPTFGDLEAGLSIASGKDYRV